MIYLSSAMWACSSLLDLAMWTIQKSAVLPVSKSTRLDTLMPETQSASISWSLWLSSRLNHVSAARHSIVFSVVVRFWDG